MDSRAGLKHLAIIMDGNGRWALSQGLPRIDGHAKGAEATVNIVKYCCDLGIKEVSLFGMSTENTGRPIAEVSFIQNLVAEICTDNQKIFHEKGIRVRILGRQDNLKHAKLLMQIKKNIENHTRHNQAMKLNILFNYSGRWEIHEALKSIHQEQNIGSDQELDDKIKNIFMQGMQYEPDLCIRTGGEKRLSNFMLWQLAYSELYFSDILWPSFTEKDLDIAIADFFARKRRFGLLESYQEEEVS